MTEKNKYFTQALIILNDTIRKNRKTITKEQLEVINKWTDKISEEEEEVTREMVIQLSNELLDLGLDWIFGDNN